MRVLFICHSNAAWSIMAEALLNRAGRNRLLAFSAGLDPAPAVDPMTLDQLQGAGLALDTCFPKSIRRFRDDGLLHLDLIFSPIDLGGIGLTVDWPGDPAVIRWTIPDPMEFSGRISGRRNLFRSTFTSLAKRIDLLAALQPEKILEVRTRHLAG